MKKFFLLYCLVAYISLSCMAHSTTLDKELPFKHIEASPYMSRIITDDDRFDRASFYNTIYLDLTKKTYSIDNKQFTPIPTVSDMSDAKSIIDDITIAHNGTGYITVTFASTSQATHFFIQGVLEGTLEIIPDKTTLADIALELHNAEIRSKNYPAITVNRAARTFIHLAGTNHLVDGRQYGTGYSEKEGVDYYTAHFNGTPEKAAALTQQWEQGADTKATLYSAGQLLFSGTGALTIDTAYKHGIYSKDYIRVWSGNITVHNAGRNCIRSRNGFVMDDGTVILRGTGTHAVHPNDNSRGIIVEGNEGNIGEGFIYIAGGTLDIETTGKAMSAKWDIDDDAKTATSEDDPNPVVYITDGTINIRTTDSVIDDDRNPRKITYTDVDGVLVTEIEKSSPEGIEGKTGVLITGGTVHIYSTDDALNASLNRDGFIAIQGGIIDCISTAADALDSNGNITISGGVLIAVAPMGSEDGFDCDGTLAITGGTAIGISGSTREYASTGVSATTQNTFVLSQANTGEAGSTFAIKNGRGDVVFVCTIPAIAGRYSLVTVTAPQLSYTDTYTVYRNVSVSGGKNIGGLYTELPTVSGGTPSGSVSTQGSTSVYLVGVRSGFGNRLPGGAGGADKNRDGGRKNGRP